MLAALSFCAASLFVVSVLLFLRRFDVARSVTSFRWLAVNHGCFVLCWHKRRETLSDPWFEVQICIRGHNPSKTLRTIRNRVLSWRGAYEWIKNTYLRPKFRYLTSQTSACSNHRRKRIPAILTPLALCDNKNITAQGCVRRLFFINHRHVISWALSLEDETSMGC
jgi:hypothetical protein